LKALILAGGFGKRLRPLTFEKPKPMLEVAGLPLIERQIRWLKGNGIDELVICVGYLREKIIDFVGNGSQFGVTVEYSVEEETAALGTGGAIKKAESLLHNERGAFYVINGDILTTIDPRKLDGDTHHNTVSAVPMKSPFGIIAFDSSDNVTEFLQKPVMNDVWINAGVYYFTNEVFRYLPDVGNFGESVLPMFAKQGKLKVVKFGNPDYYWRSIDSHWDLEEASKELLLLSRKLG
jgi:NDP-sugar pyrophosphorylase family protein